MTPAVRTTGLAKSYHGRPALRGIDLDVPAAVVFGCLGPNGAGKTTTIRLLAGLMRPTAGRAEVFGVDVVRQREQAQRHIGYLPGDFVAYPHMTGEQYLRYLASLRGGVERAVVETLAKRLDLDLTARIGGLSHGNRQKIGIVQAFMHGPDLLILDEPTTGLDPLIQREFLAMVRPQPLGGRVDRSTAGAGPAHQPVRTWPHRATEDTVKIDGSPAGQAALAWAAATLGQTLEVLRCWREPERLMVALPGVHPGRGAAQLAQAAARLSSTRRSDGSGNITTPSR